MITLPLKLGQLYFTYAHFLHSPDKEHHECVGIKKSPSLSPIPFKPNRWENEIWVDLINTDHRDPGIKAKFHTALTDSVLLLQTQYLVLDRRDKPSCPIQNIMTVGAKLCPQNLWQFSLDPKIMAICLYEIRPR